MKAIFTRSSDSLLFVFLLAALVGRFFLAAFLPLTHGNDVMAYSQQALLYLGDGVVSTEAGTGFFPPGYSLFLAIARLCAGSSTFYLVVILQNIFTIVAVGLLLWGLFKKSILRMPIFWGFLLGLEPFSAASSASISPESFVVGSLAAIYVLTFWTPAELLSKVIRLVFLGVVLGALTLVKSVLVLIAFMVVIYMAWKRAWTSTIYISSFVIFSIAMGMCLQNKIFHKFTLTNRAPLHIFNRVVAMDRTLDIDAPKTHYALSFLKEDDLYNPHWKVLPKIYVATGGTYDDASRLLGEIAIESIKKYPFKFVYLSALHTIQYWFLPPDVTAMAFADSFEYPNEISPQRPAKGLLGLYPNLENGSQRVYIWLNSVAENFVSPFLQIIALLGIFWGFKKRNFQLSALALLVLIVHFAHSAGEMRCQRYLLMNFPFVWIFAIFLIKEMFPKTKYDGT